MILFLTGTISQYLSMTGKEHFAYDFRLLSGELLLLLEKGREYADEGGQVLLG